MMTVKGPRTSGVSSTSGPSSPPLSGETRRSISPVFEARDHFVVEPLNDRNRQSRNSLLHLQDCLWHDRCGGDRARADREWAAGVLKKRLRFRGGAIQRQFERPSMFD
jgi:hypothetical protein